MQSDEDFNVKFVSLVRHHKCLYDKKVPEYRNKEEQERAWLLIADETRESVSHCKERWRNLRACLSRYMKQQSSSDPQHKPYYLREYMNFLVPFLKSHQKSSQHDSYQNYSYQSEMSMDIKNSDPDDTNDQQYLTNPRNTDRLSETEAAPSVSCAASVPHVQIEGSEVEPEVVFSTTTERILNNAKRIKLENPHSSSNTTSAYTFPDNTTMDFFRSILPDLQDMNAIQRRKFKIGVLELIDDVLLKYPEKH